MELEGQSESYGSSSVSQSSDSEFEPKQEHNIPI